MTSVLGAIERTYSWLMSKGGKLQKTLFFKTFKSYFLLNKKLSNNINHKKDLLMYSETTLHLSQR